jgi:hypothetical protein
VDGLARAIKVWPSLEFASRQPGTLEVLRYLVTLVQDSRCKPWVRGTVFLLSHVVENADEVCPWNCFLHDLADAQEKESAALPRRLSSAFKVPMREFSVELSHEDCQAGDSSDLLPTAHVFGDSVRGENPRLVHAVASMMTSQSHAPGYFSGQASTRPFRRTPFAGIAEIPATPDGFGRLRFKVPPRFGNFTSRKGLPQHAFHISATVTPAGFCTDAHLDYFGACSLLAHFEGAKIWITCPRSPHNAAIFDRPDIVLGNNLPILQMLHQAEQLSCQIIDTPCAFALDAFEYHAVISLSNSIHMGGPVYCAQAVPSIVRKLRRLLENLHVNGISRADARRVAEDQLYECLQELKHLAARYQLDQTICEEVMQLQEQVASPDKWHLGLGRSGEPDNGRGERAKRALPSDARRLQVDRVWGGSHTQPVSLL